MFSASALSTAFWNRLSMVSWTAFALLNARWVRANPAVDSAQWTNWLGVATGLGALLLWLALGTPWAQLGPTQPYRPDAARPWRRGGASLVELPVAVTPHLRLPAIGGSLLLSPKLWRLVLRGMREQAFFNLELHGMDLMDAAADGLPAALRARQPDLRVPLAAKLAALSELLGFLREHCAVVPLCEVAEIVQRQGGVGR